MPAVTWLSLGAAILVLLFVVIGVHFAVATGAEITPARRGSAHHKENEDG